MDKLRRFMYGRYGVDELCYALVILGMVFTFTARVSGIIWFQIPAYLALIWAIFRIFSKNQKARSGERAAFLKVWNPVKKWFRLQYNRIRDIKTHRYFTCPNCKNTLRVPKGKGEITIICPVCKAKFDKKT
ncbi:MAG: hypothetical protein SPF08_01800 [Candidatus Flemingibacterium sp.]|nr:hypothetical protein [Candidatus Flemingibacterium sp.]